MLGDPRLIELAHSLMLSLPGTPVLRYGEEIGMGDNLALSERNAVRTPMQWSAEPNAGFSTAEKLVRPVISRGTYAYEHVNVATQQRDAGSPWRSLARMLQAYAPNVPRSAGATGAFCLFASQHVLALEYTWRGSTLSSCVHNLGERAVDVRLRLSGTPDHLINLIDEEDSHADADSSHRLSLEPHGYRWYRSATPSGKGRQTRS